MADVHAGQGDGCGCCGGSGVIDDGGGGGWDRTASTRTTWTAEPLAALKSTCAAGETGDHDHNGVDHSGGAGLGGDDHGGAGGAGGGMLESQLPQFQCQARRRCERACTRECEFQEMEGLFYGRWKGGFTSNWVFRADSPRPHAAPAAAGVWVLGCRGAVEGRHSEPPPPVLTGRRRRCSAARNALIDQPVGDGTPRQLASGHNGASIERL
jgi:hypothetical protein